ncbi:hypothetical protein QLH52_19855 [Methylomonas sp. OY6]|uniref:Uncharacterized protein n=1 Tax=Methylomonas defluvii TaxID=3045149 RepID=A0ABU4UK81_9GAMM|nr:hypothetical protein [Methylomonas sp. OY6]MDX8129566.1 hypothetical protein [Methylomonas sp. OY6]
MDVLSDYSINLSSAVIQLEVLYQYKTYLSVLTGHPTHSQNERLVEKAINYAKEKLWCCENPYLITPVESVIDISHNSKLCSNENQHYKRLPFVTCCATFSSSNKGANNRGDYSQIHIVWFQDHFALPIADDVLNDIRAIDWSGVATPCYF